MRKITRNILVSALMIGLVAGDTVAGNAENVHVEVLRGDGIDVIKVNEESDMSGKSSGALDIMSDERIYCVGSVSKVYVTAAVMQLVDRGLVELDEPITTYIPDFTMADERYIDITVRMLMDHTSGIMGTSNRNMLLYDDNYHDADYLLTSLATQHLTHASGEYAAYCNDGFDLLEIIVENVTGMDYTEYVVQNIATPVGATHTGSPLTIYGNELNAPITFTGNVPYDYDYCMMIGAGGIYATASDVANFGSAFFSGNDVLLSSQSQDAMATRWNDDGVNTDIYEDANGLGWDYVESLAYEQAGVTVVGKGGDITNQHAHLLVAPEQEISVAVLSSGGNSNYNQLAAEAILDVVLEEQGIEINHEVDRTYEFTDEIPEEYLAYEGFYVFSSVYGPSYAYISFDDEMMHVQHLDFTTQKTDDYRFLSDGSFVSMDENGLPSIDLNIGRFVERDGHVYIAAEASSQVAGLGTNTYYQYAAERIDPNPVSEEVESSYRGICGRDMVILNERYSSTDYDRPFGCIYMADELPGYIYVLAGMGGKPLKIADETHAVSFTTMPCSSNRDLLNAELTSKTLSDGTSRTVFATTTGIDYRFVDEIPVFDSSVTEVALHDDEAQWFVIGDEIAGSTITADCPEDAVIYVYNKYHEVVYSTHMRGASDIIPLPSEGFIMFAGLDGGSVSIH